VYQCIVAVEQVQDMGEKRKEQSCRYRSKIKTHDCHTMPLGLECEPNWGQEAQWSYLSAQPYCSLVDWLAVQLLLFFFLTSPMSLACPNQPASPETYWVLQALFAMHGKGIRCPTTCCTLTIQ
jgi:hypothetical protein